LNEPWYSYFMIEIRISLEDFRERDHTADSDLLMDMIRSGLFENGWVLDKESMKTTFIHPTGLMGDYCEALMIIAECSACYEGHSVVSGVYLMYHS